MSESKKETLGPPFPRALSSDEITSAAYTKRLHDDSKKEHPPMAQLAAAEAGYSMAMEVMQMKLDQPTWDALKAAMVDIGEFTMNRLSKVPAPLDLDTKGEKDTAGDGEHLVAGYLSLVAFQTLCTMIAATDLNNNTNVVDRLAAVSELIRTMCAFSAHRETQAAGLDATEANKVPATGAILSPAPMAIIAMLAQTKNEIRQAADAKGVSFDQMAKEKADEARAKLGIKAKGGVFGDPDDDADKVTMAF